MYQSRKNKKALADYQAKLQLARSGTEISAFETESEKNTRVEKCKKDYALMIKTYFPHYATSDCAEFHLQFAKQVKRDKTFKGFAEWGRGLAKSVHADIFIPFWLWMNGEPVYLVIIGNNHDKAKTLLDDLQAEFEANPKIINDFGEQKKLGKWESGDFETNGGFKAMALGMGQSVRGLRKQSQRPNILIMDDCEDKQIIKNPRRQDDVVTWVESDLIPTMDGNIRRFILANNRFAPIMTQTKLQERHPKWKVSHVKAYDSATFKPTWHQKYADDYYRIVESEIGSLAARAEYNHEPHVEGKIFKDEMIQWCKLPRLDHFKHIIGHWDVAYAGTSTADYNAVKVWGVKDKNFYYINGFVKKSKMVAALEWMCDFQINLPDGVIVHWRFESQFWNDEVERTILEVEERFGIKLNIIKVDCPKSNKYDRMLTMHPYYQNSRMWYNIKMKAHNDTQVGLAQLKGIEPGYKVNDDSPDADQQAIAELSKYIKVGNYAPAKYGKRKKSKQVW